MRLAGLTAGVTGSYVGYMAQRMFLGEDRRDTKRRATHARAGRRIRDELQLLRGPVMKLGQALSLHTDLVPEEMLAELTKLQMEAPGMHPSLALAQFKASVGRSPEQVFKRFDAEPFAAASLGQVHRAVMRDGACAAVKIQYPGIRAAIENDFRWIRNVTLPAQASGYLPKAVLDEMESQIVAETDYVREADHIELLQGGPEAARVRRRAGRAPRLLDRSGADDVRCAGPAPRRVSAPHIPRSGFAISWAAACSSSSRSRC